MILYVIYLIGQVDTTVLPCTWCLARICLSLPELAHTYN